MVYKRVYVCDECTLENPVSSSNLPWDWWGFGRGNSTTGLSFCSTLCLARYAWREFGEGG
jgi:hypothetical protein